MYTLNKMESGPQSEQSPFLDEMEKFMKRLSEQTSHILEKAAVV